MRSKQLCGSKADEAISSVLLRMPSGYYNTHLGWSLNDFQKEHLDTLNGQAVLIIVGDGHNNYHDPRIDIFSTMTRRAGRTIWLTPEPSPCGTVTVTCPNTLRYATMC